MVKAAAVPWITAAITAGSAIETRESSRKARNIQEDETKSAEAKATLAAEEAKTAETTAAAEATELHCGHCCLR